MTLESRKRLVIPLLGYTTIQGNISLVVDKEVTVHVTYDLKLNRSPKEGREAVDLGYTEVMTDTSGTRYGEGFGELQTEMTKKLHKKMQQRHKLYSLKKTRSMHKAKRIKKFNLGREKLDWIRRSRVTIDRLINTSINHLIILRKPSLLITEDLNHSFSYHFSKNENRKLSAWVRGRIKERISFKALAECFRHEQVNPAYSSQTCCHCDFVDDKNRNGDRFQCTFCRHEDIADRVAALNLFRRYDDKEIGRYTPYRQVKIILMNRFHRRLETGSNLYCSGQDSRHRTRGEFTTSCRDTS